VVPPLNNDFPEIGDFASDPFDGINDESVGETPVFVDKFPAGNNPWFTPGTEGFRPGVSGIVGKSRAFGNGRLMSTVGSDGTNGDNATQEQAKLKLPLSIHSTLCSSQRSR
jgi:hypothetical protein